MALEKAAGNKRRRLNELCAQTGWDEYTLFEKLEELLGGDEKRMRNIRAYLEGNTYAKPRGGKRPQVLIDFEKFCAAYGLSGQGTLDTSSIDFGMLFSERNRRYSNILEQYRDVSFNQYQIDVDQLETYRTFKASPSPGRSGEIKIAKEGQIYLFDYFYPGKPRSYRGHVVATQLGIIYLIGYENTTNHDECIFMMLFEPQDSTVRGELLLGVQAGAAKAWNDDYGPRLIGRRIGLSRQVRKKGEEAQKSAEPHPLIIDWLLAKGGRDNTSAGFTADMPAKLSPGLD